MRGFAKAGVYACLLVSTALPASARKLALRKVTSAPALTVLPMHIGGRSLRSPEAQASDFGTLAVETQWPGVYFEAAFRGSEVFFRVGPGHEILHVVVDNEPPLVIAKPQVGTYRLFHLKKASHTIRVQVATESPDGPNTFGGFGIPSKEEALPVGPSGRQIEFIGDSHTVGYGNTSTKRECSQDEVWATTDVTQGFGPLTAGHYQAEYQVNAISGRGIVRNYNNFPGDTLPAAYPFVLFDKKQTYNDPAWKPQLLVIALGTNDFSTALNPGEPWKTREELHADFERTYVRFLQSLRAANPDAFLVLWATGMADGEIESEVQKVVDQAKAQGETRLDFLPINDLAFTGCHSHPSLADDRIIENRLILWVDAHPDLWQGR